MPSSEIRSFTPKDIPENRAVVVYNPQAGDRSKESVHFQSVVKVAQRLRNSGVHVSPIRPTRSESESEDLLQQEIENGVGLFIVKGGDGTLDSVAFHAAKTKPDQAKPHIVSLGGGTQNIFQRSLSPYGDPEMIAQATLFNGEPMKTDLGVAIVDDKYRPFLTNASIGIDADKLLIWESSHNNDAKKSKKALFDIYRETVSSDVPFFYRESPPTIGDDDYSSAMTIVFENTGKYGGIFPLINPRIARRERMTDGLLEYAVVREGAQHLPAVASILLHSMTDQEHPLIQHGQLRDTTLHFKPEYAPITFQHGGVPRVFESSSLRVQNINEAVTVWTPRNYGNDVIRQR